jgi:hypothetical protein
MFRDLWLCTYSASFLATGEPSVGSFHGRCSFWDLFNRSCLFPTTKESSEYMRQLSLANKAQPSKNKSAFLFYLWCFY